MNDDCSFTVAMFILTSTQQNVITRPDAKRGEDDRESYGYKESRKHDAER
jgi:hypothetical protein